MAWKLADLGLPPIVCEDLVGALWLARRNGSSKLWLLNVSECLHVRFLQYFHFFMNAP